MRLISVALPLKFKQNLFTYSDNTCLDLDAKIGCRVLVPFGKKQIIGVVYKILNSESELQRIKDLKKIKSILEIIDSKPIITQSQIQLCRFIANYYFAPIGQVLKLAFPPNYFKISNQNIRKRKKKKISEKSNTQNKPLRKLLTLSQEQKNALNTIHDSSSPILLEGVTGSGKTEVYLRAAGKILKNNQAVLILVPEISLTPQLKERFETFFQTNILILHSGQTARQRELAFLEIKNNQAEAKIILGTRSAIFAPIHNLGLIIVDEEHDASFKQDESPRYHARDVALWRAKNENAKIILGSATPSLESVHNANLKKYTHAKLTKRVNQSQKLPLVEIIDLKARKAHKTTSWSDRSQSDGSHMSIISAPLRVALENNLAKEEQSLIFLNRRGYATVTLCEACGEIKNCPNCATSLTYHKYNHTLLCHHCDFSENLNPVCPSCSSQTIKNIGLGTERVEAELKELFPSAVISRLDSQVAQTPNKIHKIIDNIKNLNTDIIIGTQMIAKGHDFPNLSLVGIVLADTGLGAPDFRAEEKTFQILTQVAGRAGRADKMGRVILQTFNPENPAIQFAKTHDVGKFSQHELANRKLFSQAPYTKSVLLRIEGLSFNRTNNCSLEISNIISDIVKALKLEQNFKILGPSPAPIEKLRNYFRFQIFIKSTNLKSRTSLIYNLQNNKFLDKILGQNKSRLITDIDPINLL